jgi:hypothetical protein
MVFISLTALPSSKEAVQLRGADTVGGTEGMGVYVGAAEGTEVAAGAPLGGGVSVGRALGMFV